MYDMKKMQSMGVLDKPIIWKSGDFDIDDFESANRHNEARVKAVCGASDFFVNDSFDVIAKPIDKGSYRVEIMFSSESKIALWNKGRVVLDYNFDTQHWSMDAYIGKRQWMFCKPEQVLNTIIAGLECTGATQESAFDVETVEYLVKSIRGDSTHIVTHSDLYLNENGRKIDDCEYTSDNDPYEDIIPVPD